MEEKIITDKNSDEADVIVSEDGERGEIIVVPIRSEVLEPFMSRVPCPVCVASKIKIGDYVSERICYAGEEVWYRLDIDTDGTYVIYTEGDIIVSGVLYDWEGRKMLPLNLKSEGNDLKIYADLVCGLCYYIKLKAVDDKVGSFTIRAINVSEQKNKEWLR